MDRKNLFVPVCVVGAALAGALGSLALAQPAKDAKPRTPAGQPEMTLPPGWTTEEMQACMLAGTPGKMHAFLARSVGTWHGNSTMWMAPGADPVKSECTFTVTSLMDGRYIKGEMVGEIPEMGPMNGLAIYGFDNVSKKFVSNWIDNHSTGIMNGTGDLSPDGRTLTWNYTFNCPRTGKPAVMREVEHFTSDTNHTLEVFTADPKSGKEYRTMVIDFTRKP